MELTNFQEFIKNEVLAVVPLRGKVAFPNVNTTFEIGRDFTMQAVEYASDKAGKLLFVVTQKSTNKADITESDLYSVVTVCQIRSVTRLPAGTTRVQIERLFPARIKSINFSGSYF